MYRRIRHKPDGVTEEEYTRDIFKYMSGEFLSEWVKRLSGSIGALEEELATNPDQENGPIGGIIYDFKKTRDGMRAEINARKSRNEAEHVTT